MGEGNWKTHCSEKQWQVSISKRHREIVDYGGLGVGREDEAAGSEGRDVGSIHNLEYFETMARNLVFILDIVGEPLTLFPF